MIALSLAVSEIWGFKVRAHSARTPPRTPPLPLHENEKLHIRPRDPKANRSLSVLKSFVAFRETVIVRIVRRTTLIARKSTLIVGKCLDVRRTLRIRLFWSRRRTFNVSFLRFLRESDLRRGKTFCAERNKKICCARVLLLDRM